MDLAHILHQSPTSNRGLAKPLPSTHYPPPKPPPLDPRGAALGRAIQNADADILREVLLSICRHSGESFTEASKLLLVVPSMVAAATTVNHINSNKKRKFNNTDEASERASMLCSRYEVCETCKTTFDVTENGPEACQTHDPDGSLEVNPDAFPDDDDIQAGEHIDTATDWRVEEFPEGFSWNCCDALTNGEKCIVQMHVARM